MTLDEAIALGLDEAPEDPWRPARRRASPAASGRSRRWWPRGLTNREIAGKLYLSVRTVEVHVDHILTKLGFRTRTQLAAWMHEEGLAPRTT